MAFLPGRPGKLLRFTIRDGGVQFLDGRPVGADLHYEGPASPRRARADPTSKVRVFPLSLLFLD